MHFSAVAAAVAALGTRLPDNHAKSMNDYRQVLTTTEILANPKLKYTWECFACDLTFQPYEGYFTCHLCSHKFHKQCTILYSSIPYDILAGDEFYQYTCFQCSKSTEDSLFRLKMTWTDACHIILFHQTLCYQSSVQSTLDVSDDLGNPTKLTFKYFHWKVLIDQMRLHWDKFWTRNFNKPWIPQFTEPLTLFSVKLENNWNHKFIDSLKQARFVRSKIELGKPGYYGLLDAKKNPIDYIQSNTSLVPEKPSSVVSIGYKVLPSGKLQKISTNSNATKSGPLVGGQNSQKSLVSTEKDSLIKDISSDQGIDTPDSESVYKQNKLDSPEEVGNKLLSPLPAGNSTTSSSFKLIRGAKYTTNKVYWPFDFDVPNPTAGTIPTSTLSGGSNISSNSGIKMAKGGNDNLIHPRVVHMPSDWKPLSTCSSSTPAKGESPPLSLRNSSCLNNSSSTNSAAMNGNLLLFPDGFRTAKATHGVSHGSWYFEVTIIGAAVSNPPNDSIQLNRILDQAPLGKSHSNSSTIPSGEKRSCILDNNETANSDSNNISKCTCKDINTSSKSSLKNDSYICTCKESESKSNPIYAARVGIATVLSDTHAPCGYDEYGYSLCSITGKWYHCRGLRNLNYDPAIAGISTHLSSAPSSSLLNEPSSDISREIPCTYQIGDTIGVHLNLPSLPENVMLEEDAENQLLGLQSAREKEYPPLRSLNLADENGVGWHILQRLHPGSRLTFYKNGQYIGHIPSLYRGKYYPALSGFHAVIRINFGWIAIPESNFPHSSAGVFHNLQGFQFPPSSLSPASYSAFYANDKSQNSELSEKSDISVPSYSSSFLCTTLSIASLPFVPEAPWLVDDFKGNLTFSEARLAKKQKQDLLVSSSTDNVDIQSVPITL